MEKGKEVVSSIGQTAVGISISLDKLVQTMQAEQFLEIQELSSLDAVICSLSSNELLKEKARVSGYSQYFNFYLRNVILAVK